MPDVFWLASIQGIVEFLPISSTAHLLLASSFFHPTNTGRLIEVALHGGTLLTLFLFFRKDCAAMTVSFFRFLRKGHITPPLRLLGLLCIGTVPVVVAGFLLETHATHWGRGFITIGVVSMVAGTLLLAVDRLSPTKKPLQSLSLGGIVLIGIFQVLALIPGFSRLGSTLMGARLLGYRRQTAAHLSFLLAIPAVLGALTLMLWKLRDQVALWATDEIWALLIACGTGYGALTAFMLWLRRGTLVPFALYRIAFGAFLVWYGWEN